jgi:hypothetical protein
MLSRRQEVLAFVAALCLHATALFVLRASLGERVSSTPFLAPAPAPTTSFDVELGDVDATASSDESAREMGEPGEQRVASARFRGRVPTPDRVEPDVVELEETEGLEGTDPEGTSANESASRPLDLGIGPDGWQRWARAPKAGDRRERSAPRANRFQVFRAPPVSSTGGLQEGLEERDRELGLGPQGRVMSAFHAAAHQPVAPQLGKVRFDVKVSRSGVVEVTVGSASGDVESWRKVAAHVAADLRASLPQIAPPREGVKLVIELVAEETMPNGTKITSLHGPRIEVAPPKLEAVEKKVDKLKKDNPATKGETSQQPAIDLDLPGVYVAERGKVCSYRLGVAVTGPVFQGGCDLSNLGAKPQRMIRTRVLEQTMF